ncbi:MAG: DUF1349 domain-containing protein [Cyclobacteriaceae bacterium]|nr:hypothetical protein [Cytophagales bacterium]HNP77956.1 DUF1349 domain-containing protein [Cyclobacteriaceae bacterium]
MRHFIALILLLTIFSCKKETNSMESPAPVECSFRIGEITFSQALHGAEKQVAVEDQHLVISSPPKSDYFNEPDESARYGNAPILLTRLDNTVPFTWTATILPVFTTTYDAGAIYLYVDSGHWLKFAFEQDERGNKRIVTVRTRGTSDDNNHDIISQEAIDLKISSDGKSIGFYYSTDHTNWQVVRVFKNDYPGQLWLGISAQSPWGEGNKVTFSNCALTPGSIKDFRKGE